MAKTRLAAATFAALFGCALLPRALSAGYDPAETRCGAYDDPVVGLLATRLQEADKFIPNIPPEEREYLNSESLSALRVYREELAAKGNHVRSNQMYGALQARPLYQAWQLRLKLEPALDSVKRIVEPSGPATYRSSPEAEKLDKAAYAIGSVAAYAKELGVFLATRAANTLPDQEVTLLYGDASILPSEVGFYMSCKLAKIMGRQP